MFTSNNTAGYTQEQLDALNDELRAKLEKFAEENPEFSVDGDEYYAFTKAFENEVASR
jgi:hypothetical protein